MQQLLPNKGLALKLALWFFLVFFCGWQSIAIDAAENVTDTQQELEAVSDAISEIQAWLTEARSTQSDELQSLQQAELQISTLSQSVTATTKALEKSRSEISSLAQKADQLRDRKADQRKILEQTIRSTYIAGNQNSIELLLNQKDLSKSARMLYYQKIFTQDQLERIASFQKTLDEFQSISQQLEIKTADLEAEQLTLKNSLQGLNESKAERELTLKKLRTEIASRNSRLEQLQVDQLQLQQLIEEINRAIADIPTSMQRSPFNLQRGKLPMPVRGQITDHFGSRYGDGDLTRQGISIAVSEGTAVQAVHPGRVVFSDWLRGAGLLVIIDHGQGYMSLYGANQALSKQAGDWVDVGDIVATSGMINALSGSQSPGLYFEIRQHGEAQNPSQWLSE